MTKVLLTKKGLEHKPFKIRIFEIRNCFEIRGGGAGETGERKMKNRKI